MPVNRYRTINFTSERNLVCPISNANDLTDLNLSSHCVIFVLISSKSALLTIWEKERSSNVCFSVKHSSGDNSWYATIESPSNIVI